MLMLTMLDKSNTIVNQIQLKKLENQNMDNLAERIEIALSRAEMRPADLARAIGSSRATISDWLSGKTKTIKGERLMLTAKALRVSPEWLATGHGSIQKSIENPAALDAQLRPIITWDTPADLPTEQYVMVPRYDIRFSAGHGQLVYEPLEHDQPASFRAQWIQQKGYRHGNLICAYAHGDSMEPRIYDGDTIMIDKGQTTVADGKVYALTYGEEVRVKRLYRRPDGGLLIRSDNAHHYPEFSVTANDLTHIQIIGRVVWVGSEL